MSENNKNLEEKMSQLEARNLKLETDLSILASRSQYLAPESFSSDDEIDLAELWRAVWSGKWLIAAITSVFAVASVFYALSLPNEYKSTVLLAPATNSSTSGLSKMAGQFGGLASLAGINFGGSGSEDKSVVAMEIIQTWGFLEAFIKSNNIEVEVFAAKGWNSSQNKLLIDPEIYDVKSNKWLRNITTNSAEPTSWQLYLMIKDRISISQDKETGLINMSVEHFSPFIAKKWLDKIVAGINLHMQQRDRDEALKSIKYLKAKIKETKIADMQSVFYQLIEEQTKTLMLTEVSDEYVFKTLDPAKVPEIKFKPRRAVVAILGLVMGGIISVMIVLIKYFRNRNKMDKGIKQ
jgi:uncharacterized protein involved in exopolysaccharide biosynthesis